MKKRKNYGWRSRRFRKKIPRSVRLLLRKVSRELCYSVLHRIVQYTTGQYRTGQYYVVYYCVVCCFTSPNAIFISILNRAAIMWTYTGFPGTLSCIIILYLFSINSSAGLTSFGGPVYSGKQIFNGFFGIISSNKSFLFKNTNIGVFLNNGFFTTSVKSAKLSCILFTELSSNRTDKTKKSENNE